MSNRVIAVIPAKAHSRRVPNKNMRLFNGKPLLYYTVDQALRSQALDEVYVSTDSPEIQEVAKSWGALVPFLRPPEFSADHVHGSVPILHMLEAMGGASKYGYCVQLLATSPLKTAKTMDAVVQLSKDRHTNVLSVTPTGRTAAHFRYIDENQKLQTVVDKVFHNFQSQDLPEVYAINGAVYCAPVEDLLKHRTFQYGNPTAFPMHPIEAMDIDTEADFIFAEAMADLLQRGVIHT